MVHQIHTTEKPADPRRAVVFAVALMLTSLAAAWGVQQLTRSGQAIVLGERVNPDRSPFSIRLPGDWQLDDEANTTGQNVFVFRKTIGANTIGRLYLVSGPGVQTASSFAVEQLTLMTGTQAQLVHRPEEVSFGPDLRGVQIIVDKGNPSIACRVAKGPKGNLYAFVAWMRQPFGAQIRQFLDLVTDSIQWNQFQITQDMDAVAQAVGLRFDPPEGASFGFDPQGSVPYLHVFADEATDRCWHVSISPTVLVAPRTVADMAEDQRLDLGWKDQETQWIELSEARKAAVNSRQTRAGHHAFWTLKLTSDRPAIIHYKAPGENEDQARAVCQQIAESLILTDNLLNPNVEPALAAGQDILNQIHDRGLQSWWTDESQTLLYIRWENGQALQWITQIRESVGDRDIEGFRMQQDYFTANPLGKPQKRLSLTWDLDNAGMDIHAPADPEERYVTVPAFDLATFLLTQQSEVDEALIRVSSTDDPTRRYWRICKVLPPQSSAESPGTREFRIQTARDYAPEPHIMVFNEQGILIREELEDSIIKQATEREIQRIFIQRKMIRLGVKDGES